MTTALRELAGNILVEEQEMAKSRCNGSNNDEDDENTEDWVDKRDTLTAEQLTMLNKSVQPVRLMLVKVCVESKHHIINHNSLRILSFAKLHLPSRTHLLLSFPIGMRFSKNWSSMLA